MQNKRLKIYLYTLLFVISCVWMMVNSVNESIKSPFYIQILHNGEMERIDCWKDNENRYYILLPSYVKLQEVYIYLDEADTIQIGDLLINNGMSCKCFELDVSYELTYTVGWKVCNYDITFIQSKNIATMYIDTESGGMDFIHSKKGNEESGDLSVYTHEGNVNYRGELESIKGRGNYSWEAFEKKSYSIKFFDEVDLLGMGQAQKWILLANADDPSNLRNKIVYDFAQELGLYYSPSSQWIDLYLNDEYVGLYLLCERNEVHSERVDIEHPDSFLVSLEMEKRLEAQNYNYLSTEKGQSLRIHYPVDMSKESLNKMIDVWNSVERAILSEDGIDHLTEKAWTELIDLDSWVRKILIEEMFGNIDAGFLSQFFYYNGNNQECKIFAGPVWDYDHSMGSKASWQLENPMTFYANRLQVGRDYNAPWYHSLYQKEEFYNRMVIVYENECKPLLEIFFNKELKKYIITISNASKMNQIRWFDESEDMHSEVEFICNYMDERIGFLDNIWIKNNEYNTVRAVSQFGGHYAYYAVPPGESLTDLPTFEDTDSSTFLGWYYVDIDEPFDPSQPIYEDIEIYAKWQENSSNWVGKVVKLVPLAVIGVMFLCIFFVDIKRMKRNG